MDIDAPAKAGSAIQQKKKVPSLLIAQSDLDIKIVEEDLKERQRRG